ncbi:MAG: hypothetical protein HYZ49_03730 [Chloroflexi bacterium]|nr:hypothetical protein [Chloroflexota bacterium]
MVQLLRKTKHTATHTTNKQMLAAQEPGAGRVRALLPLIIFLALVTTLVFAGLLQAGRMLADGANRQSQADSGSFTVGQSIPTSFGVVAIEGIENLTGLTSQDLSGVTHGIQNLVLADQAQIQVSILLTNHLNSAIYYSPTQFRLLVQQSLDPVLPSGSTIEPGMLDANSSIEATLSFVVPRNGDKLWIRYDDPGGASPILVDAGRVDEAPASVLDDIHH